MKKNVRLVMLFAVFFALLFTGVATYASENDELIKSKIEKTYAFRTYLVDDSITIEVDKGVVTLTGEVLTNSHRTLANETARNISGVTAIENKLVTEAEVAAKKADYWIGKKVTLTLMFHRNVNASNTTVEVKDGVVTLKGPATSAAQKELTTEYAKDISGVISVNNVMTVVAPPDSLKQTLGEKIDDASIVGLVKAELMARQSTNGIDTKVVSRNGAITLTGIAKNEAEKTLVSKLVEDIRGVISVDNEMTIKTP